VTVGRGSAQATRIFSPIRMNFGLATFFGLSSRISTSDIRFAFGVSFGRFPFRAWAIVIPTTWT
jgi:hypothetical protein